MENTTDEVINTINQLKSAKTLREIYNIELPIKVSGLRQTELFGSFGLEDEITSKWEGVIKNKPPKTTIKENIGTLHQAFHEARTIISDAETAAINSSEDLTSSEVAIKIAGMKTAKAHPQTQGIHTDIDSEGVGDRQYCAVNISGTKVVPHSDMVAILSDAAKKGDTFSPDEILDSPIESDYICEARSLLSKVASTDKGWNPRNYPYQLKNLLNEAVVPQQTEQVFLMSRTATFHKSDLDDEKWGLDKIHRRVTFFAVAR